MATGCGTRRAGAARTVRVITGVRRALLCMPVVAAWFINAAFAVEPTFYTAGQSDGAPFSRAVIVGETIYIAGHLGIDPQTNDLVGDDVVAQTRQVFANIQATLNGVGAALGDIVKCTVFLDDIADFQAMNTAYVAALPGPKPARTTVGADGLALDAKVEIECIAVRHAEEKQ